MKNKRYPDKVVNRGHVSKLQWNRFTFDLVKCHQWITRISHGRQNSNPGKWLYVCSNHFQDGKPTKVNPNPTLYLISSSQKDIPHTKRKKNRSI